MAKVTSKGQDTRERLVEAATDLFSESGFEKATLAAVAARCGLTHAAAIYHFKSKLGLLEAVTESALERAEKLVSESYAKDDDAYQRLVKFIIGHLTWMIIYKTEAEVLLILAHFASTQPDFSALYARVVERKREQIEILLLAGEREGLFKLPVSAAIVAKCLHDSLFGLLMNGMAGRRLVEPMKGYMARIELLIRSLTGYATSR